MAGDNHNEYFVGTYIFDLYLIENKLPLNCLCFDEYLNGLLYENYMVIHQFRPQGPNYVNEEIPHL